MDEELKKHIREPKTWLRGFYILLFMFLYSITKVVIFAIILFQFGLTVFTGNTNKKLVQLGLSLSTYSYQILTFLTFNSDYHPYPFGTWPSGTSMESSLENKDNV
ncbi:MAG: DUF4389 domain-containing protein [Woeseiaceae bacterium]